MPSALVHLDEATTSLSAAVSAGAPRVSGSSREAAGLIEGVEQTRRLTTVVLVDVLEQITESRSFYDHGHANARVMFEHVAGVSGSEAHRLDKIRRMISGCDQIAAVWRNAGLSVDKAALLGRAYANPRTRERFLVDQKWFLKRARRYSYRRFEKMVARWIEVHDVDGSPPDADPTFERRNATLNQDFFSKAWKLDATLGSLQGSFFNQTHAAYVAAEFAHDWAQAQDQHGDATCVDLLARTHAQRSADALVQMAADAVNSAKPSAPVKRVHNITYTSETYEALIASWVDAPAEILDPDRYIISDLDGHPIAATAAFADSLTATIRRVIQNAAGVTIDMSTDVRLFTGLARLGVTLATTECYWPGCHVPTSQCQIDHLRPAARGGTTEQVNGLPACQRHNRLKERGYTVTRQPDGTITITTPQGDTIES